MARKAAITVNVTEAMKLAVARRCEELDRSESNYVLTLIKRDLARPAEGALDEEEKAALGKTLAVLKDGAPNAAPPAPASKPRKVRQ